MDMTPPNPFASPGSSLPGVHRLLDRLIDSPIAIFDATWTRISQNALWTGLTGDAQGLGSREATVVCRLFRGDPGPIRHGAPEDHKKAIVADLCNVVARHLDDPGLIGMMNELKAASSEFTHMWNGPTVASHGSESRVVVHPQFDAIELDCAS